MEPPPSRDPGISAVLALAEAAKDPHLVGHALAEAVGAQSTLEHIFLPISRHRLRSTKISLSLLQVSHTVVFAQPGIAGLPIWQNGQMQDTERSYCWYGQAPETLGASFGT